jgi:NitT/TauT family transport system substrate-binding protein
VIGRFSFSLIRLGAALSASALVVGIAAMAPAMAQAPAPVKVLLDWAWLPYHAPFLIAQDKGYYKEAGLDVTLEQGRGSATTALLLSQGGFDIAHLNLTNAAQKTAAAFIGIKGKVKLDGPQSLKGLKIGSTPGGSDGLSLRIFTAANGMKASDLNVVALDANAKTTALFGGTIDVVSGDSPAFNAYVRATGQEPVDLQLADAGVPLVGFGFAVNDAYLAKNPEVVRKFLAATKRGFADAARDPKAACELIQAKVHLAGTIERCIDYNKGLLALSTPPTDPDWGKQSTEEWTKLIATLKSAGEMPGDDKPVATFFTNDYVPK